jgi:hypothetical protein
MKLELDFSANKDCADIVLQVNCDGKKIAQSTATQAQQTVCLELPEDAQDHVLQLVMSGKNNTHTTVDSQGQPIEDVFFTIDRLEFEDLDMKEIFCQGLTCYTHSFNQPQPTILDEFYGFIGCNGTIDIKFRTPFYLWLDEHMK